MNRKSALYSCALILCLVLSAQAASVPQVISHQGRLLDSDETPVNGTRSLTFALYEASSGGAPLWLEVHPSVTVTDGLFHVLLGSVTPVSSDLFSPPSSGVAVERHLEVSVDGVALSPRLRLASAPYSVSSSRVDGDVVTSPGELSLSGPGGSTTATIRVSQNPVLPGSEIVLVDGGGSTTGTIRAGVDSSGYSFGSVAGHHVTTWTSSNAAIATVSNAVGTKGIATGVAAGGSSISMIEGGLEVASLETTDDSTRLHLTGARLGNPLVNEFVIGLKETHGLLSLGSDSDGDGLSDGRVRLRVTPSDGLSTGTAGLEVSTDRAAAGPRQSVSMDGSFSHAQHRVITDLDRDGNPDVVIVSRSEGSEGKTQWYTDGDDDGFGDQSIECKTNPGSATVGLSSMSGSTTGTIRMATDSGGVANYLDMDDDGDMVPERSLSSQITPSSTGMAIKTKGTGAQRSNQSMESWGDSSRSTLSVSDTGEPDSPFGRWIEELARVSGASTRVVADLDGDGLGDHTVQCDVDATSSRTTWIGGMSGSTTGTIRMAAHPDSVIDVMDMDSDGDGVSESSIQCKTHPNGGVFSMSGSTTGTIRMAVSDSGPEAALTIGSATTSHFIDVEGGAYCDGTNWVNASDVASKENFKRVDGAHLLDQIADLEITRWNYKGQDGVEHIGPTAQDFKAAFGVGADDKSISTIDPSGIALAAIQELQKQNEELRAQLEALNRKVESLSATR